MIKWGWLNGQVPDGRLDGMTHPKNEHVDRWLRKFFYFDLFNHSTSMRCRSDRFCFSSSTSSSCSSRRCFFCFWWWCWLCCAVKQRLFIVIATFITANHKRRREKKKISSIVQDVTCYIISHRNKWRRLRFWDGSTSKIQHRDSNFQFSCSLFSAFLPQRQQVLRNDHWMST